MLAPGSFGYCVLVRRNFPKFLSFFLFFFFFFCFHPISHLLHWPVSVHKAPAPSPRQTPQAAQLQQEPQQEGTATGEVLELSNTFLLRRLSLQQHSCTAAQFCFLPESTVLTIRIHQMRAVEGIGLFLSVSSVQAAMG